MRDEVLNNEQEVVTRRKDPNYTPVTAHIPKHLAKKLKFYCAEYEATMAEVVEEALEEFFKQKQFMEDKQP